ncbi:MAG: putative toxin-antitoxin system toxin component, PIN family [bacterium]
MRVVIDTNVFISGIFFGGEPRKILDLIGEQILTPCFNISTFTELELLLRHQKFSAARNLLSFTITEFLDQLKNYSLLFEEPEIILDIIKEDKSDNNSLVCAISAQADFIISGDKHLLKLKSFNNVPILTPRQFLKSINL